jgi:hypothetical protein
MVLKSLISKQRIRKEIFSDMSVRLLFEPNLLKNSGSVMRLETSSTNQKKKKTKVFNERIPNSLSYGQNCLLNKRAEHFTPDTKSTYRQSGVITVIQDNSNHILNTGRAYGTMTNTMDIVKTVKKGNI